VKIILAPVQKFPLGKNNCFCATCGAKLSTGWLRTSRFCYYTGKWYCPTHHRGDEFYIPSKIITAWDFRRYPVCHEAFQVLRALYQSPQIRIQVSKFQKQLKFVHVSHLIMKS
jgi:run domain Beclin-1 interacting cysteine-rich containing protein